MMMPSFIDMSGQVFERLTILHRVPSDTKRIKWLAKCQCGTEKVVDGAHVRYGRIRSCGCLQEELAPENARINLVPFSGQGSRTHGMSHTPIYKIWKTMHQRCRNPNNKDYDHYGGRGIRVCERWNSFENFYADMGERPPELTLDREDENGIYEPSNCRWADWDTQNDSKRKHRLKCQT